jgi:predicted HNH restriction endonuclease
VHHLAPVSSNNQKYKLNPTRDLRPVCPNCHAALHYRKSPPYEIDEMKSILRGAAVRF